jgi:RNA polymerase sigma-70 factor (sigma-E family)
MDFDAYVAARGQELLRFAFVLTRHHQTAEDVVQSALADAFRHWKRVSKADQPEAYIRRMIVTTYLGTRRRRSSTEVPIGVLPELPDVANGPAHAPDPADIVADEDAFGAAIAGLSPRARAVLVLRYYADLDDASIAGILGIRRNSVSATASRALSELRSAVAAPKAASTSRKDRS